MTTPDKWETGMEILQRMQELSELGITRARQARFNPLIRDLAEGNLNHDQLMNLLRQSDQLMEPMYSDFVTYCQVEFNKTVIQMLTDLDHRKSEQ